MLARIAPVLFFAVALFGCGEKAETQDDAGDFAQYSSIAAAIARAGKPVLHEGLPHPISQQGHFEREKKRDDIREWQGYWFYNETLPITDEVAQRLTRLVTRSGTFTPFGGEKKCGGFHPDFALEWTRDDGAYVCFLCFGCREAMFITPKAKLRCDMTKASENEFKSILTMRKNRPGERDLILID